MMEGLNNVALDYFLRGEGGEVARRVALEEVRRRAAAGAGAICRECGERVATLCQECAEAGAGLDLLQIFTLAADRLADRKRPVVWAGWVGYILEALQAHADGEEYATFLRDLRGDIDTRLREGSW